MSPLMLDRLAAASVLCAGKMTDVVCAASDVLVLLQPLNCGTFVSSLPCCAIEGLLAPLTDGRVCSTLLLLPCFRL